MFSPLTGEQASPGDFRIIAGSSDIYDVESTEQDIGVMGINVHPFFSYAAGPGSPDDVAVLHLDRPLNLTTATAQAISVASPGATLSTGSQVELTGFGRESINFGPSGELRALDMSLQPSEHCGGEADAVFLCANAPAGSGCGGDSGGGLTSAGSTPVLLGTLSTVEVEFEQECHEGADNGFMNLAAPEIHDFIENEYSPPPKAPRGGKSAKMIGARYTVLGPSVGETITCEPGSWSGEPAFTYAFIDEATGQVLQSGASSTYQVTSSDLGVRILCRLQATNMGGTAVKQTEALQAVEPAEVEWGAIAGARGVAEAKAKEKEEAEARARALAWASLGEVSLIGTGIAVQGDGIGLVKLGCKGGASCGGKLTLSAQATSRAKGKKKRMVTIGAAQFSIVAGGTATVKVKLNAAGRGLLKADHERLAAHLTILKLTPVPEHTQITSVRLSGERPRGKTKK
jgi:hypothetical protein